MPDQKTKTIIQAHALRSAYAKAALMHGSQRGVREMRKPFAAVLGGLGIALVIAAVVMTIAVVTSPAAAGAPASHTTPLTSSSASPDAAATALGSTWGVG